MRKHDPGNIIALLLSFGILFTACSGPLFGGAQSLEITDSTGHTVTLQGLPQEITIAGKASVMVQDAVFMFQEAEERITALENRRQSVFDFLPVVDPAIEDRALFEMGAGPEQIAAVNPDLVLMKNFMKESLGEQLESLGIPVLYLNLETPEVFYQDIKTLGQVFGNPDRAEEINTFYQDRVSRVENLTADVPQEQRPRVLLLEYSEEGGEVAFSVPPASWLQTRMVELAGGRPVWKEASLGGGWAVVNFEQIAAWDPDHIYLVDYAGNASQIVEGLYEDELWSNLSAVQDQQLYAFAFDFYSWDQPDTRWILGLEWLTTKIHPEQASGIDIKAEVHEFYSTLYRLNEEEIQDQVLPKLTGDIP